MFFLYWCYTASLLCYSYVCLYYHACLHYVNKKWSDKDTDCTCCFYCILKCLYSWNHKNLSFPWIYDVFNFLFFEFLCLTTLPCHHLASRPDILHIICNNRHVRQIVQFKKKISSKGKFWRSSADDIDWKRSCFYLENIVFLIRQRKHVLKYYITYILLILMFLSICTSTDHVLFANKQRRH